MKRPRLAGVAIVALAALLALFLYRHDVPERPTGSPAVPSDALSAQAPSADVVQPTALAPSEAEEVKTSEHRSAVAGPHGRVVEAGTDRPIEGLAVELRSGNRVLAETVTNRDGVFRFPEPERSRRTVEVISENWRTDPSRYRLDEDQSKGLTALVFRAERIIAAPLRGSLRDRTTGEPVPDFFIEARGPSPEVQKSESEGGSDEEQPRMSFGLRPPPRRTENIITGADGRFESDGRFEAGLLHLVLIDHPSFEQGERFPEDEYAIEHQHAFEERSPPERVEFEISIGPTFRLDMALPDGTSVADFYATFPQPSPDLRDLHRAVANDPDSAMALFYGGAMKPNVLEQEAPLREGAPVWARFRRPVLTLHEPFENEDALHLEVRSRDGHWSGSAPVSSIVGIYPEVVSILPEARGSVEGTVLDAGGKPVPTAWIQLVAALAPSSSIRELGADRKGRFEFKWLAEGQYEVVVQTDRYEESRSTLSIVKGRTKRLEIRLAAGVPLGPVSGVLRSRTGQHRSKGGRVSLASLDDPAFYLSKSVSYRERQGEFTAAFVFENVPSGNYELSLRPLDNRRWETLRMKVSAPADGLEFICEDDGPTFDLEFRALDARTGAPIERSWNIVWQGNPLEDVRLDDDWETGLYKGVPGDVPLQWALRAEGFRLATGDETDIRTEAAHRVVEVRLEQGWGQIFKVTTREHEPIEGVELVVDGDSIGVTDAQGMVSMNLDMKPGALEFRYKDWVVTWGTVDPNEDGFGWGPETPVYMGPDH